MEEASTCEMNCCSTDRKGEQRGEERMSSENVSISIRISLFVQAVEMPTSRSLFGATNGNRDFRDE